MRFRPGTRVKYSDGTIYKVGPDGSHRREDGGNRMDKAAKKAEKKARRDSRRNAAANQ